MLPRYAFAYSGAPAWEEHLLANGTSLETNRLDIVRHVWPDHYNNSFPDTGVLTCFCMWLASKEEYVGGHERSGLCPF